LDRNQINKIDPLLKDFDRRYRWFRRNWDESRLIEGKGFHELSSEIKEMLSLGDNQRPDPKQLYKIISEYKPSVEQQTGVDQSNNPSIEEPMELDQANNPKCDNKSGR